PFELGSYSGDLVPRKKSLSLRCPPDLTDFGTPILIVAIHSEATDILVHLLHLWKQKGFLPGGQLHPGDIFGASRRLRE
ncbi:hypothetical protein LEMLEM_LOCUS13701, partial [Lemmus lemmus]